MAGHSQHGFTSAAWEQPAQTTAKSKQAWLCHLGRAVRLGPDVSLRRGAAQVLRVLALLGAAGVARRMRWELGRHFSLRTHQSHPLAAQRTGKLLLKWFADRNLTLSKT